MPIIVPGQPNKPAAIRLPGRRLYADDLQELCNTLLGNAEPDSLVLVNYVENRDGDQKELPLSEVDLNRVERLVLPAKGKTQIVYVRRTQAAVLAFIYDADTRVVAGAVRTWLGLEGIPENHWWRRLAYVFMPVRFHPRRVQFIPLTHKEYYAGGRTWVGRFWRQHQAALVVALATTIVGSVVAGIILDAL